MSRAQLNELILKRQGLVAYSESFNEMKAFTLSRVAETPDEVWILQHPSVYTQGVAGKAEHILRRSTDIPLVQSDRGGQITYHGPGQLILYPLLDVKRRQLSSRELVQKLEQVLLTTLAHFSIKGHLKEGAPGVYVNQHKIASIGLRIKQRGCYHGIALNVDMSLDPFQAINPCGYEGLKMCQMRDFNDSATISAVETQIIHDFVKEFGYTGIIYSDNNTNG